MAKRKTTGRTRRSAPAPAVDLAYAKHVLEAEADAIRSLVERLGDAFVEAARMLYACKGNIVASGIGKAGIIAQKISATLASTGTGSHFLHAAEAVHGDLGRVRKDDVVLILSYGGETAEVTRLLGQLEKMKVPVIAMTGNRESTLARQAKVLLWMGRIDEVCPMGLAPSATTTAMLALGDALALAVLKMRQEAGQFTREEFALYHPGGSLGRHLLMVETVMRKGEDLPAVRDRLTLREALAQLRKMRRRSGAIVVTDARGRLAGVFTDADLRRLLEAGREDALDRPIGDVMTRQPKFVRAGASAAEAIVLVNRYFIEEIPVVDDADRVVGLVDVQDLFAEGVGL
ncbi:MAG TPA: KpsF/GutQ family sugar-phosphate isomerase [Phycisphaerae bacterium]|nr:KpsF/GutQ family sugar-phosphate isomerase [Phycisphaerae bacterium]